MKPEEERKPLSKVTDVQKTLKFRPYSYIPWGDILNLSNAKLSQEVSLVLKAEVPVSAYFLLAYLLQSFFLRR